MDKIIMPELITPKLTELIAENPEVLKMIIDHQPGEKVMVGQDCTIDCNSNPTNVKLVFCNVTIGIDDTDTKCDKDCGAHIAEEQIGNCKIKIERKDIDPECTYQSRILEKHGLIVEMAVLEAIIWELEKILRLIPRQACNRKLIARCKKDLMDAEEKWAAKKRGL